MPSPRSKRRRIRQAVARDRKYIAKPKHGFDRSEFEPNYKLESITSDFYLATAYVSAAVAILIGFLGTVWDDPTAAPATVVGILYLLPVALIPFYTLTRRTVKRLRRKKENILLAAENRLVEFTLIALIYSAIGATVWFVYVMNTVEARFGIPVPPP